MTAETVTYHSIYNTTGVDSVSGTAHYQQILPPQSICNIVESGVKNIIKPTLQHHLHTHLQSLIKLKY
jgi:hypothetical protein